MRVGINLDPVVAHGCLNHLASSLGDDHGGGFDGHVTVDAVGCDAAAELLRDRTTLPLVTRQAARGVARGSLFRRVGVVAGGTGHRWRGQEAAAALEESDLVAVDIGMLNGGGGDRFEELAQRSPGNV